jgi:hypothetical protein
MAPLSPLPPNRGAGAFCAARTHTCRAEFGIIHSFSNFLGEFFVYFAILYFPAIGVILSSRGERNAKTNLEALDL